MDKKFQLTDVQAATITFVGIAVMVLVALAPFEFLVRL